MSMSVDIHWYNKGRLIQRLQEAGVKDLELLNKIMDACGITLGEYFVLVCNEYNEDYNMYYSFIDLINNAFGFKEMDSYDIINKDSEYEREDKTKDGYCGCYGPDKWEFADENGFEIKGEE